MMFFFRIQLIASLCLISLELVSQATMGLLSSTTENEDGYVLFAPNSGTTTYLIDKCGYFVHSWPSTYRPGLAAYLLDDGSLLRTGRTQNQTFVAGGIGGVIERIDWEGNLVWSYSISSSSECQHHDIHPMSNGNVLVISYEYKTIAQAIEAGRDSTALGNSFWSEKIIEIEPQGMNGGTIVWEWHMWDHLVQEFDSTAANYGVVSEHPELLDINYGGGTDADWLHLNGIDYNAELDQIVMSTHNLHEIWIIDHSTSTAEAASHVGGNSGKGGDFLYRWGNPQVYGRGTAADQKFFGQHNPTWIRPGQVDEGKLMVFNNGLQRPGGNYSTVDVIEPLMDASGAYVMDTSGMFLPQATSWMYSPTPIFYAMNISGAQRLPSGNTLICSGPQGIFMEVDYEGNLVWNYRSPVGQGGNILTQGNTPAQNAVFRCTQYPVDYPAFIGRDLTVGAPIELNPLAYDCTMLVTSRVEEQVNAMGFTVFAAHPDELRVTPTASANRCSFELYDISGRRLMTWSHLDTTAGQSFALKLNQPLSSGIYVLSMDGVGGERVVVR